MLKQLTTYLDTKKYLVFDFDRTLAKMEIDWNGWVTGMIDIFDQYDVNHGYRPEKNPHEYYNALVSRFGQPLADQAKAFNQAYEAEYLTGFTPNVELVEFVKNLTDHTLFVYSSNSRPTVLRGLETLGIVELFTQIISKDDVTYVKPHPEGFYLIENFRRDKDQFLMIGDSSSDRGAARAAEIDFVECRVFEKYEEEEE